MGMALYKRGSSAKPRKRVSQARNRLAACNRKQSRRAGFCPEMCYDEVLGEGATPKLSHAEWLSEGKSLVQGRRGLT